MLFFTNCVLIAFCRDQPEYLVPKELLAPEEKKGMMENVDYRDQQGFPAPRLVNNLRNNHEMFLQLKGLSRLDSYFKVYNDLIFFQKNCSNGLFVNAILLQFSFAFFADFVRSV